MGVELMVYSIHRLSMIAPVDAVTVFSNHDHERVFYLGEVLQAAFSNSVRVSIDNSPKVRKYYCWGGCLLGLAHGHNEKPEQLPLIMAQESKVDWANTFYREFILGHLHHSKKLLTQTSKDYQGIRGILKRDLSGL
jgi:hypothetical protein